MNNFSNNAYQERIKKKPKKWEWQRLHIDPILLLGWSLMLVGFGLIDPIQRQQSERRHH